jgi:septum formation topological specificity factor MinE
MKVQNTIRNSQGVTESNVCEELEKDIIELYKKYKNSDIDYDSFHLLICDLSSINRTMSIAIDVFE